MKIVCRVMGHARSAHRVRRAGHAFLSVCRRCNAPMARPSVEAEWRTYDPAVESFGDDKAASGMVSLWNLPKV